MAQRQFRSDDTSPWPDRYGNGSDGAIARTVSSSESMTLCAPVSNATVGGYTCNLTAFPENNLSNYAAGQIVVIYQTRNGGDQVGDWELNKIQSVAGGGTDITFSYPLQHNYSTTAQLLRVRQCTTYSISAGVSWDGLNWRGNTGSFYCGGLDVVMASVSATIDGTLRQIQGYGGAQVPAQPEGNQGDGTGGDGTHSTAANGNGGGGSGPANQSTAGAGGGNRTAGTGGSDGASTGGLATATVAGLTIANFGGGGGSANNAGGAPQAFGGRGGGGLIIIAPVITVTGLIDVRGQQGPQPTAANSGGGGGGAGGFILLKGQSVSVGSSLCLATGSAGTPGAGSGATGGTGGTGGIHIDSLYTPSGTTNPAADMRIDGILGQSAAQIY